MFIYVTHKNGGKKNPRVPVVISGQDGGEGTIGPTVWLGIGPSGVYQGAGFHTSITDAKKLKQALDHAIAVAEQKGI